jgi:transcriptional regulator with XRE-family HTH domain
MQDAADRLRQFMGREKLKQEGLARLLGVRQSQVSTWLRRTKRPGLRHVFKIEKLTGIKPETWPKVEITRPKGAEGRAA